MKPAAFCVLALLTLSSCLRGTRDDAPVPTLSDLRLRQAGVTPMKKLQGQVVLVAFIATWCFPCIADLAVLERLQTLHASKGFTVVAVGMDIEEEQVLVPFAENYQLPYPLLVGDDRLRSGQSRFGRISALPSYVLFDREGKVVIAYQGVASPAKLLEVVENAVGD